jgi:CHAD domain-containing protein
MGSLWHEADFGRLGQALASRLKSLERHHSAVLESGDAAAIHKMRVATRKLQASLDLLELPNDPFHVRAIKKDLRRRRRSLSRVRNYDVFLAMMKGPGLNSNRILKRELEARRAEHFDRARLILEAAGLNPLAAQIEAMVLAISSGPIRANAIAERSAARLQERLSQLRDLAKLPEDPNDPEQVHQLRIAIKRLRYLLEVLSEILPANLSGALAWLRSKQDELGRWHDLYLFEEEIISIASRRKFLRENLSGAAKLLEMALRLRRKRKRLSGELSPVALPRAVRWLASGARIKAS